MTERIRFVNEWTRQQQDGRVNFSALCRAFKISRDNGYKWLRRYVRAKGDFRALEELSRRPHSSPNTTDEATVALIIKARKARPRWGPKTLRSWLVRQGTPSDVLPSSSTIGSILKREGLVRQRQRRPRTPPSMTKPSVEADCPNAVWCIDFKGQFRTTDGMQCYPLTVIDAYSRFLIRCESTTSPNTDFVRRVLESAFREFGLPARIRSDNGPPFASPAPGGLTELSAWWIKLGIKPERIEPGKPQQNGRQERFHRTLKRETALPPRASMRAQQRAFDQFRRRYNEERPHHALGMEVPDELHYPSTKCFIEDPSDPRYAADWDTLRVRRNGTVNCDGVVVNVGAPLRGELVGARSIDRLRYELYFGSVLLGMVDPLRVERGLIRTRGPRP